jgi:hypothetical protein
LTYELNRVCIEDIGSIKRFGWWIDFFLSAIRETNVEIAVELIVGVIASIAIELVKPSVDRTGLGMHVPFTNKVATVPERIEQFRDCCALPIEATEISRSSFFIGNVCGEIPDTSLRGIQTGHQCCSAWAASRRVIELGEA